MKPLPQEAELRDCWFWAGQVDLADYGQIYQSRQTIPAHRAVYETVVGVIPKGLELDHLCRVHRCVNPDHLEPVTRQENNRRTASFRRKEYCRRGLHKMEGENIYLTKSPVEGNLPLRHCVPCRNKQARDRYRAKRLALSTPSEQPNRKVE